MLADASCRTGMMSLSCRRARTAKEVAYVTAGRLIQHYQDFCLSKGIDFTRIDSVRPHDDTTLFCSAGMQQYKPLFSDPSYSGTVANSQACLRMGDLDEIGDGTHLLHFTMLGLFSFREMTVGNAIDFWLEFLATLGLVPDHVTIHPDRLVEWTPSMTGVRPSLQIRNAYGAMAALADTAPSSTRMASKSETSSIRLEPASTSASARSVST
ncbi:hypothetical protein GGE46_005359 [Rhizobium etli]|uniref:Alanyl-tRNA synthetase class IIc N-terminal domain-containing protein n=1 Tax=Rhizobium etli TaxID=29449 RepID=A0A7W6VEC5_RHIET|nr:hypothetical protein [Rhizobium etli]MBB4538480.1 hypothetical protein [Rhizobium etli]